MHSNGPIALVDAATDYFALASYISGRRYQCTQMGPWHWRMLLPIALLGPIRFLGGTADALRWAHHIGRCCCQLLRFGTLYFWKVLPMHSDGPISICCCQWLCFGPLYCSDALPLHSDGPIAL